MGRATQGVRLIDLEKRNDQIGSVCKVTSEPEDDNQDEEEAGTTPPVTEAGTEMEQEQI